MPEYSIQHGGRTYSINPAQPLAPAQVQEAFSKIIQNAQTQHEGQAALTDPNTPVEEKRGFFQNVLSAALPELKKAALPTIGGIGGAAVGGLIATPSVAGVPAGVLAGEAAGSALGEKANQMLGITEPSNAAIGMAAGSGLVGRATAPIVKGVVGTIVKGFGGRELVSDAASSLLNKWLSPDVSSKDLFAQAAHMQTYIPTFNTQKILSDITTEEAKRAPTAVQKEILGAIKPLQDFYQLSGTQGGTRAALVPDLMEEAQRLRYAAGQAYADENTKLANSLSRVRAAMLQDLSDNGAPIVKEASTAYRKEMALEDLSNILRKPNPLAKYRDFAANNSLFDGAFNDQEKSQIERILKKVAYVPPSGFSGVIGRSVAGTAGYEMGGPGGAIAGVFGPDVIRSLLGTKFGRDFTEKLLAGSTGLDAPKAAALAMFARGMMAHEAQPLPQQPQTPPPATAIPAAAGRAGATPAAAPPNQQDFATNEFMRQSGYKDASQVDPAVRQNWDQTPMAALAQNRGNMSQKAYDDALKTMLLPHADLMANHRAQNDYLSQESGRTVEDFQKYIQTGKGQDFLAGHKLQFLKELGVSQARRAGNQ